MIKLSDIIKSGGGNAKINRFINRYVLSKKEKKDIIDEIKTKGSSSGSSSKYAPRYFSVDWNKVDSNWNYLFEYHNDSYITLQPFSTVKNNFINPDSENADIIIINTFGYLNNPESIKGFSYIPLYLDNTYKEMTGAPHAGFLSFEQCIECINTVVSLIGQPIITLNGITEITEEEYYKID